MMHLLRDAVDKSHISRIAIDILFIISVLDDIAVLSSLVFSHLY